MLFQNITLVCLTFPPQKYFWITRRPLRKDTKLLLRSNYLLWLLLEPPISNKKMIWSTIKTKELSRLRTQSRTAWWVSEFGNWLKLPSQCPALIKMILKLLKLVQKMLKSWILISNLIIQKPRIHSKSLMTQKPQNNEPPKTKWPAEILKIT